MSIITPYNSKKKYAIVDENDKVIEYFRVIATANYMLGYYKKRFPFKKLKVKKMIC